MRLRHQSLTVLELPCLRGADALTDRVGLNGPDTQVDLHGMHRQTYPADYPGDDITYSFLFPMHSLQWAQNALQAVKEGYDAFSICTLVDPLSREIRRHHRYSARRRRRSLFSCWKQCFGLPLRPHALHRSSRATLHRADRSDRAWRTLRRDRPDQHNMPGGAARLRNARSSTSTIPQSGAGPDRKRR